MEPGDIATWVTAIIAAAGIFGAWRAYVVSRATRNDEIDRDRRRQAAGISAWMSQVTGTGEGDRGTNGIMIVNQSESAIYDLEVTCLVNASGEPSRMTAQVCPPGRYFVAWNGYESHKPYDPQRWALLADAERGSDSVVRPYTRHGKSWRVTDLSFTDGFGMRWHRGSDGCLELTGPATG